MSERMQSLRPLNLAKLEEFRKLRAPGHDSYKSFWDELESVLRCRHPRSNVWEQMEKDDIVIGNVWKQNIGNFYYKHTVHKFSYLYVKSPGLAIRRHSHTEPANNGEQIRKIKEWYFFSTGEVFFCDKDEKHQLENPYDFPIYVLSVKVCRNGRR